MALHQGVASPALLRHQPLRRAHQQLAAEAGDPRHSLEPPAASQRRGRGAQDVALQCHEVLERGLGEQAARGGVRWGGGGLRVSGGRAQGLARVHWRLRLFGVAGGGRGRGPLYEADREALSPSSWFERVFGNFTVHAAYYIGNIRFHINLKMSIQKC